jgi:hypothetical protein
LFFAGVTTHFSAVTPPKNKKEWIAMSVSFYKQANPSGFKNLPTRKN